MNGLNHNSEIESNMFQSMVMILVLLQTFGAPQVNHFAEDTNLTHFSKPVHEVNN